MKKTKVEKGITLIALIITIVVLLILAVVTIGAIKNSKIITHSQKASDDYTVAQEKEQIQLALSEWEIQKNTSGNTQNFREVMASALEENATVGGENDGPVTVIFKKTNNEYTVTSDGKIKNAIDISNIEKYMFGKNLEGRSLSELIIDENGNWKFVADEELGIGEGDITVVNAWNPECRLAREIDSLHILYFKCNNRVYKTKFIQTADYDLITIPDNGITEVYNYNNQETRVGKKVKINDDWWTILYDDQKYGLQIIEDECYYGETKLGYYEGKSNYGEGDFKNLEKNTDEFKYSDLNNSNSIDTDAEKALYSYNNAIEDLNKMSETSLIFIVGCNTIEEWENYKEKYIDFVRSVGSNPNDKDAEGDVYESDNFKIWPINNTTYSAGIFNKRIKDEDLNYESDVDRMVALGITDMERTGYWLASRVKREITDDDIEFDIRCLNYNGIRTGEEYILSVGTGGISNGYGKYNVRPVVKLKSDVQFKGSGTETDPYTIAE